MRLNGCQIPSRSSRDENLQADFTTVLALVGLSRIY